MESPTKANDSHDCNEKTGSTHMYADDTVEPERLPIDVDKASERPLATLSHRPVVDPGVVE
jgi:hypothetical protein